MDNNTCLPPRTRAFICASCGAVSQDPDKICKVQGVGLKSDWCGTPHLKRINSCIEKRKFLTFECKNCKQVSTASNLLCNPKAIDTDSNFREIHTKYYTKEVTP